MDSCLEQKLKKYNQEHIIKIYNRLSKENQEKLEEQIERIDFEQIKELYEKIQKKEEKTNAKVEPIDYIDKEKLTEEERQYYIKKGTEALESGKIAAVTMAGGQGTRLGHKGPKGTYNLGIKTIKTLFEIICESLKRANKKYNITIPWYIMTSEENNEETTEFFKKHDYFGYNKEEIKFFKQGQFPMIDTEGKVLLDENGIIKEAADGHGGVYIAMEKNNIYKDMKAKGMKWVVVGGIDNVLSNLIDPVFMGLFIDKKYPVASKSVAKSYPEEKVGVFCKKEGRPSIIEYTELSKEMSEMRDKDGELVYGESNIIVHIFDIDKMEEISKNILPFHPAFKKANYMNENGEIVVSTEPNAYKFEAFIFDAFEQLDNMAILRVKREEEFAPVKNADEKGVDCPKTARELYENYYKVTI